MHACTQIYIYMHAHVACTCTHPHIHTNTPRLPELTWNTPRLPELTCANLQQPRVHSIPDTHTWLGGGSAHEVMPSPPQGLFGCHVDWWMGQLGSKTAACVYYGDECGPALLACVSVNRWHVLYRRQMSEWAGQWHVCETTQRQCSCLPKSWSPYCFPSLWYEN